MVQETSITVHWTGEGSAGITGTGVRLPFQIASADHAIGKTVRVKEVSVDFLLDASFAREERDRGHLKDLGYAALIAGCRFIRSIQLYKFTSSLKLVFSCLPFCIPQPLTLHTLPGL